MNQHPKIALIGICYDGGSSFMRGAAEAPPLIRAALHSESSNRWTESGLDLSQESLSETEDLTPKSELEMLGQVEQAINALLQRRLRPIIIGGDHSITYPILKAFAKMHPQLSILHFDAHPDLYDEFEGRRYSHACPFSRIMEAGLAQRLVQVGIRTANSIQREQAKRFGVEMIEMKDWQDELKLEFDSPVYISLDLDALDPAFAPGVAHHEPGGLSTRQVLKVLQAIRAPVVGADIVEYNPQKDVQQMTARVAAKFVKEIAGKMMEKKVLGQADISP
jgi:agmatinase